MFLIDCVLLDVMIGVEIEMIYWVIWWLFDYFRKDILSLKKDCDECN